MVSSQSACQLERRKTLQKLAGGMLALSAPALLTGCSPGPIKLAAFSSMSNALRTLEQLKTQPLIKNGTWDLAHVLHHAAQSVEFSMQGFPVHKPAWFKSTAGQVGFAIFSARGSMKHALDEPIPGAPDIAQGQPLAAAVDHIIRALKTFEQFQGPLMPHFAYGALDKENYTRAHLLHLADHWREVVV